MSYTNRIAKHVSSPTPEEIEEECRLIRSHWSPEIKNQRKVRLRRDVASRQFQANLRFLQFLAERAETLD